MAGKARQDYHQLEKDDATRLVRRNLERYYFVKPDEDKALTIDDVTAVIDLEMQPLFLEGVVERLRQLGVNCSVNDTKLITDEVKRRYQERLGEACPRTVTEWLKGQRPDSNKRNNRIHFYKLCFVLQMNIDETAVFFMKHFLTYPFHYKDTTDAIFFYCLRNDKPYSTILKMLEESKSYVNSASVPEGTDEIARQIAEIDSDDTFLSFLSRHCYNEKQQFQRARNAIIPYIQDSGFSSVQLSVETTGRSHEARQLRRIPLPDAFFRSLPTDKTYDDILKGENLTYDALRKALIILALYDFYRKPYLCGEEPTAKQVKERFYDFEELVNGKLVQCGFVPLYERNLFDMIILLCAHSPSPIHYLIEVIDLKYPDTDA